VTLQHLQPRLGEVADVAARNDLLKVFGVERFVDMEDPEPPAFLVRNVLEVGHPTYIYGGRGTLKSMNSLAIAIAVASPEARSILGYPVERHGPVVVFDSELNKNVFNNRAVKICNGLQIPKPRDLYYKNAVGMHPSQSFPELHQFCEAIGAVAAVVDSLGFALRGDPESYRDVRNSTTEYIDPLIAKGIAVVLVEHKPHTGNHIFGSVAKGYHGRYIFRVEDMDGTSRQKGERNTQLINEKASFADEGQKITLLTKFQDDEITIEPQGTPDEVEEEVADDDANAEVKVRRALEVSDKTTKELAVATGYDYDYLRNRVLPPMRKHKAIYKVGTKGRHGEALWGLHPPGDAATPATSHREVADVAAPNQVIETPEGVRDLANEISSATVVGLDLETMPQPGWKEEVLEEYRSQLSKLKKRPKADKRKGRLSKIKDRVYKDYATNSDVAIPRVISLATPGEEGINVLVDLAKAPPEPLLDVLRDKTLITHNGAFDLGVLRSRYGYTHESRIQDTQLLYILHHYADGGDRTKTDKGMWKLPDPRDTKVDLYGTGKKDVGMTSLAHVAHKYLGRLMDKGAQKSDWSRATLSKEQVRYALEDTSVLLELVEVLTSKLHDLGMGQVAKLEARAFPAMVDMSLNGFPASREIAQEMAERYRVESEAALREVHDHLPQETAPDGKPWNWNADAHIRAVLKLLGANLDKKAYPKTEKTGDPSTSVDALRTIKQPEKARQWVDAYLKYGALRKQYNDFARQYASLIRPDDTIKGSFDTVSTGRLSCRKPNLQQVPSRGERQSEGDMRIRDIFRPKAGDKFIVADFSQVELLIAGTIAARETGERGHMLEVFRKGGIDVHTATAATMMGKPPSKVTKAERTLAKAVNFGLVYGAQAETLLEYARNNYGIVDMTLEDAQEYRRAFFERYPELAAWHRLVEARCNRGEQYSKTPMGRLRKLPKWMSSGAIAHTTAKNSPVQGAGADAIKLTMAKIFEGRRECPGNPRLNASVHDEVVVSVAEDHAEEAAEWVRKHMADAEREAVVDPESPIVIDVEIKDSWA
jgi:DNA polymerase I